MSLVNEEYDAIDRDIIEYLMWVALEDILRLTDTNDGFSAEHAQLSLHLVNLFSTIIGYEAPDTMNDVYLDLRKRLLYTTFQIHPQASYMVDFSSNQLKTQREQQRARSLQFLSHHNVFNGLSLPTSADTTLRVENHTSPILLDILPHFISLSATFFRVQKTQASENWLTLAAELMATAAAEYSLQYSAPGFGALAVAFSYGFSSEYLDSCDDDGEVAIASLFWKEQTKTENPIWIATRRNAIKRVGSPMKCDLGSRTEEYPADLPQLLPIHGMTFLDHLRYSNTYSQHSRDQTLRNIRKMMKTFSDFLPAPLLSSLGELSRPL